MLLQIAAAYGQPLGSERAKELLRRRGWRVRAEGGGPSGARRSPWLRVGGQGCRRLRGHDRDGQGGHRLLRARWPICPTSHAGPSRPRCGRQAPQGCPCVLSRLTPVGAASSECSPRVERPARYIDSEWGAVRRRGAPPHGPRVPGHLRDRPGQPGLAILYERLNNTEGFAAERVYVPWVDMADRDARRQIPLFSLESLAPVAGFDILGITLPYELTYTNVLELLDLAGYRCAPRP
jgi:hypothetical protein